MTVQESAGLADKRATGSIPLSWARPAEDVTADTGKGTGFSAPGLVVGFLIAVVVAGVAFSQLIVPLRNPKPPTPQALTPPIEKAPEPPKPIEKAPEPATPNPQIAPEDDDTVAGAVAGAPKQPTAADATNEASKKQAQATLRAARIAARDGDDAKAAALAEDAVDKDPRCFECWSTLAFLRGKLGDTDGQRAAKMQARALAPKP